MVTSQRTLCCSVTVTEIPLTPYCLACFHYSHLYQGSHMQNYPLAKITLALAVVFSAPTTLASEPTMLDTKDDIVISASKVETKRVETGSSITVISEKYLQENQSRSVAEVLRDVAGISVATSGGLGKKTSVFIRGAASENTVIVVDGVKVSNLSSSSGGYDLSNLMTDNIERIEVLRGPQSALWGSDAMGGVINIITKKGKGPLNSRIDLQVGGNKFSKVVANINGSTDKSNYSLTVSNIDSGGISAKTGAFDDPDNDDYRNQNVLLNVGYQFTPIFAMNAIFNYTTTNSEYDSTYDPINPVNNDVYGKNHQKIAKINSYLNLLDNQLRNRLSVTYLSSRAETFDPLYWNGDTYSENSGDSLKAELQSDYFLNRGDFNHRFTLAAEVEKSKFHAWGVDEEQDMRNSSIIGEAATDWLKTIFVSASFRQDFNNKFDDTTTYKLAISGWASDGVRLHASYGTGVKNPTFSQLSGPYATPYLNPERSTGWDAGIEYNFASVNGFVDLTYFNSNYIDAIRWDPTIGPYGGYTNQDEDSSGIELSSFVHITPALRLNGQYTYMQTHDGTAARHDLLRRPDHSASLNINYSLTTKWNVNLGGRYVGKRLDFGNIKLDDYAIFNLASSYQVVEQVTVYGRLENLLDKEYIDITGYGTEGLTAFIGVNIAI